MKLQLHSSFTTLQPLAAQWNVLLSQSVTHVPFLRYEYLSTWWQTRGGGEWADASLAVITAHEGDQLVGVAPLFRAINRDGQPALLLLGSIEISDYLDLIVRAEDLDRFISGLFDFIRSDPALSGDMIDWQNLPDESATINALETESAKRSLIFSRAPLQPCPVIKIPGDWELYLSGIDKKQRHEIKRKMRRVEESDRKTRWYIVTDESTLDAEIDAFLHLMANDPAKQTFLTDVMRTQMKTSVHAAFNAGWLQLSFFEVEGEKASGYLTFDYDNKLYIYNSGLDRRFMEFSPGWVLLGYLLQWANENKRAEFDFMRGDEDYKYKFGGVNRFVHRIKIG
jgi:CelD/BcsL family acetyltransferase involved in cellulose biosynthesis